MNTAARSNTTCPIAPHVVFLYPPPAFEPARPARLLYPFPSSSVSPLTVGAGSSGWLASHWLVCAGGRISLASNLLTAARPAVHSLLTQCWSGHLANEKSPVLPSSETNAVVQRLFLRTFFLTTPATTTAATGTGSRIGRVQGAATVLLARPALAVPPAAADASHAYARL